MCTSLFSLECRAHALSKDDEPMQGAIPSRSISATILERLYSSKTPSSIIVRASLESISTITFLWPLFQAMLRPCLIAQISACMPKLVIHCPTDYGWGPRTSFQPPIGIKLNLTFLELFPDYWPNLLQSRWGFYGIESHLLISLHGVDLP